MAYAHSRNTVCRCTCQSIEGARQNRPESIRADLSRRVRNYLSVGLFLPSGGECSFTCGSGGAAHVTKLRIYLGVMPVGTNQRNSSLFYEFNTRELRRGSGFSVNAGLSTLQCQFNGLTMDYSGPPRGARGTIDTPRRIDTPMSQDNSAPNTTGSVTR